MKTKLLLLFITGMLVLNCNAQGPVFTWVKQMGTANKQTLGRSIVRDGSGNVYSTWVFTGTVDFDPGTGASNLTSLGGYDMYVQKLDINGNFVWAKRIGDAGDEWSKTISIDNSGNIYLAGDFSNTVDFDPNAGVQSLTANDNNTIFVLSLDASGNFIWAKKIGSSGAFNAHSSSASSLTLDASGNIYLTGYYEGTVDFDPGVAVNNSTSSFNTRDCFVLKLTSSGNYVWHATPDGGDEEQANSIALDDAGNIIVAGYFKSSVDFNPGPGDSTLVASGEEDLFILKLDPNANFKWVRRIGGLYSDIAYAVDVDSDGNVFSTGSFRSTVDFDPGSGTTNLSSPGIFEKDAYVLKLDSTGNFNWAKKFQSTTVDVEGFSLFLDPFGNVYSSGIFFGTVDFNPGTGINNLATGGNAIYISKLNTLGNYVWAKSVGGNTQAWGLNLVC